MMFIENKPDIEELQDSILWCLEHTNEISKYSNSNNSNDGSKTSSAHPSTSIIDMLTKAF